MDCGKVCLTEAKAKAHVLARDCYCRAYRCPDCRAWHTTSRNLPKRPDPTQYRTNIKGPIA